MQNGFKKGLKPSIIKYLAILMGIFYLLNPLHQQINTVFHKISHGLDMPNFVVQHQTASADHQMHVNHQHITEKRLHKHVLLDFMNSFFYTSNEENRSRDLFLPTIKVDKHLAPNWNIKSKIIVIETDNNYNMTRKKTLMGFFLKSVKPPLKNMGQGS